jgi:hypothetical protein
MMGGTSGVDPLTAPLTYPGLPPQRPAVLVAGAEIFGVQPERRDPLGQWIVTPDGWTAPMGRAGPGEPAGAAGPLDRFLGEQGAPPVARRTPVLSVGSNASPAQIRRKMANAGLRPVVPITRVRVHGLAVGASAHVSRPGYVPATPVADPAAVADMWVLWLDPEALSALDGTEPNYQRIGLSSRYPVHLLPGRPVRECGVYVSRHGHLTGPAGEYRPLTDQPTLITGLLAEVPGLMTLAGTTPGEWIRRTRDERVRDGIRALFLAAGIVHPATIEASGEPRCR